MNQATRLVRTGFGGEWRQLRVSDRVLDDIVRAVDDVSPRGIAGSISRMVSSGQLQGGARLPTVRALANRLSVSPTTVSQAWQSLIQVGVLITRGRSGTYVRGGRVVGAGRTLRAYESPGGLPIDLSTGTPDPCLLPDVARVAARLGGAAITTSYVDRPVLPLLRDLMQATWPFEAEAITVVNGAMDALDRISGTFVRVGSRVMVENPCFPPLQDLLDLLGAEVLPVDLDEEGPIPAAVSEALAREPVAFYLQPRAQNPAGINMTLERSRQLAALLRPTTVWVVEDDHAAGIATSSLVSIGTCLPAQTVHIRGFSKAYGPDLRLAAIGGAGSVVEKVDARRLLGPGWSSRLLQAILAELLVDPVSQGTIARARETYAARRQRMQALLGERAVPCSGTEGINMWVKVPNERQALVSLAANGIGVAPGSSFEVTPLDSDHIRTTVGLIPLERAEEVADAIVTAVVAGAGRMPRPSLDVAAP